MKPPQLDRQPVVLACHGVVGPQALAARSGAGTALLTACLVYGSKAVTDNDAGTVETAG